MTILPMDRGKPVTFEIRKYRYDEKNIEKIGI